MRTVYLAGPINGCTDEEANGWRTAAKAELVGWTVFDPMTRDYRGKEAESAEEIVDGDLADIADATHVLVNATRPTWGTAMELVYAREMGRRIVAFGPTNPSPWLRVHCDVVAATLGDALRELEAA